MRDQGLPTKKQLINAWLAGERQAHIIHIAKGSTVPREGQAWKLI